MPFLDCLGGSKSGSQDHTPRQAGFPISPAPIQCALRLCVPATAQHYQLNTRSEAGRRCLISVRLSWLVELGLRLSLVQRLRLCLLLGLLLFMDNRAWRDCGKLRLQLGRLLFKFFGVRRG
jgi:hypothetical protein